MRKLPIAKRVAGESSRFGPHCADCYGAVYVDRIEGLFQPGRVRLTFRHVESHPACLQGETP